VRPPPCHLVDSGCTSYSNRVPVRRGIAYSVGVGFLSSFLRIGGGIIHVPLLVGTLGFPMHVATANSHFVLVWMAGATSLTHLFARTRGGAWSRASILSLWSECALDSHPIVIRLAGVGRPRRTQAHHR
jgi:Sulfite exporter TauE/SafE